MAMTSTGIKLTYSTPADDRELTNLLEIPELGDGETDTIEITTLADEYHRFTDGLKNYADGLTFKFLFENNQFNFLKDLKVSDDCCWVVTLPYENATCTFGGTCSVKFDGVGNNSALTYTLTIKPNTEMAWTVKELN